MYDCFGEWCPSVGGSRCDTILDPDDRVVSDQTAITDNFGEICPQVFTSPKLYKSQIGEGIEPFNAECYNLVQYGADWYNDRSFDNFFYITGAILEEACAWEIYYCSLPWLADPVDDRLYY